MDRSILYQIAEEEIQRRSVDEDLMAECRKASNGVDFRARELYWLKRSEVWEKQRANFPDLSEERFIAELRLQLKQRSSGKVLRAEIIGWLWVIGCFASLAATVVFFRFAKVALETDSGDQLKYCIYGSVSFVFAIVSFSISKRESRSS